MYFMVWIGVTFGLWLEMTEAHAVGPHPAIAIVEEPL
jgi:hypothetical protein